MIQKSEAIVLKIFNYRETSKIAIFYSREFGKINGLLKGIRKDHKKFGTNLQLASLNDLVFYRKSNSDLHLVSQCDLKQDFTGLRENFKKSIAANYCLELVRAIMPQEDKNESVFELLLSFLNGLSGLSDPEKLIYIFQIKILSLSGFKPHFDSCVACNKLIIQKASFSRALGGLICQACKDKDKHSQPILKGTIATILHIEKSSWQEGLRLGMAYSIRKELSALLNGFLTYHLEKPLKNLKFIG